MRLEAVGRAVPSRHVSNDDVVQLIAEHSQGTFTGDLDATLDRVGWLLSMSGARERRWLSGGEEPLDLVASAASRALDAASCDANEIDLLIYSSVDRGFIEPANAYFVAAALGLDRVECFDIADACNGFTRALHVIDALFQKGDYRRALVINAEFGMMEGGVLYPGLFGLQHERDLEWSFPAFTIGEAATAAVVSAAPGDWIFRHSSRPDLAELCTIPVEGYERWVPAGSRAGVAGLYRFSAFGAEMEAVARTEIGKLFDTMDITADNTKAIFVHTASASPWRQAAEERGVAKLLFNPYSDYGNVVSASIPLGISLASERGHVERGDAVAAVVGSAGMAFSVYRWVL